ncbi:MAG: hypothetical protein ACRELW_18170 [Candidatus Rokuibacteriota bacterium]
MRVAFLEVATAAWADHGGPLRSEGLSPLMVGLLAGGLALVAGVLIVVIAMRLTRNRSSSE